MKRAVIEHISKIGEREFKEFTITKRRLKEVKAIGMVRQAREEGNQSVGYSSRPFILYGLPIRRRDDLEYIRRNGQFFLNVVGHSRYGLPYGQDRLIPIWVATLAVLHQSRTIHFNSAAEVLWTFDLPLDGKAIAGSWTAHSDAARIRLATGLHLDSFSKPASAGRALRDMRQGSSGCFFYEGGRCRIYESRPKVATSHPTSSLPMRLWLAYRRRRFPISTTPSSANSRR